MQTRVFAIPLHTRFRGITVREGMLLRGEAGWGEWSPFLEYSPEVAEPWLRCAEEAAAGDWPTPVRDEVPVNVTVPAVGPGQAHRIVRAGGCTTAKVKVAEPGQSLADDQARLEAVRDALGPSGRVRVVGRRRGHSHQGAGHGGVGAGVRRAAVRDGRGAGRRTPLRRRPHRRR
jgi:O-succinylbenzoate synthase